MPFIVHDLETAPEESKVLLEAAKEKFGLLPNILGTMASSTPVLKSFMVLDDLFSQTSLSMVEQQVVQLAVSVANGCRYCTAVHTVISGLHNIPPLVVKAIKDKVPLEDKKLQALRVLSVDIAESRGYPENESVQGFLDAGYTQTQVLEVILGISLKTLTNYTNHLAETLLDDEFAEGDAAL